MIFKIDRRMTMLDAVLHFAGLGACPASLSQKCYVARLDTFMLSMSDDLTPNIPPPQDVKARLELGNARTKQLTPLQAEEFNARFQVLTQYRNDPRDQEDGSKRSGFSATLFKSKETGELTLSIRSTELEDDYVRDNIANNFLELRDKGWMLGQLAELENWYKTTLIANSEFLNAGESGIRRFSVTGFSLGGHLAAAFALLRREEYGSESSAAGNPLVHTYTPNAPGTGRITDGSTLTSLLNEFNTTTRSTATLDEDQAATECRSKGIKKSKQKQLLTISLSAWRYCIHAYTRAIGSINNFSARLCRVVALLVVCSVLPACAATPASNTKPDEAYVKAAWAYFKNKCATEAGEKIYKTSTGVKSVLVVKPLPPATDKDHFDQFWYGDPYSSSAHSQRGILEAAILASPDAPIAYDKLGRGFDFVEFIVSNDSERGKTFAKYFYPTGKRAYAQQSIDRPVSRYGISWNDISTPESRKYWVAGSRLQVIDLTDGKIIAERIGYFIEAGFGSVSGGRRPWLTSRGSDSTCPSIRNGNFEDRWFILRVLNPIGGGQDGK